MLDVFDVSGMEIRATVNEQERANVVEGQAVTVTSDSVPGIEAGGQGAGDQRPRTCRNPEGPLRRFDVTFELEKGDARLQPGTSVNLVVKGPRIADMLVLPRQAVFEQDGKSIVHVKTGGAFQPQEVKVLHRSESRVAIEGVDEGTEVALIKPAGTPGASPAASTAAPVVAR